MQIYQNRPTCAIISLSNLKHNLEVVRSFLKPEIKIMAMVKANAYGHGILEISKKLLDYGVDYLGTAYLEEAVYLRQNGISAPILVTGGINEEQIEDFIKNNIEITSSSISKSEQISQAACKLNKVARVHLKIDTGMGRIGVQWYNAQKFIEESYALPNMEINGIFSHFAKAENDKKLTEQQIIRFDEILDFMEKHHLVPKLVHISNSAGLVNYPQAHYNMVRPGIILYGYTDAIQEKLKPVMSLKTKVSFFKVLPAGSGISYGHHYVTKEQTRIATLPIGYGDGYSRAFSNNAKVIIRGVQYPIVGNICMDQMMVDIGPDGTAYNLDDVLLFGENGKDKLSLLELSESINTIPYEILCSISQRVPRIYVN